MYSEKDILEIISKVTDNINIEKLSDESASRLLKSTRNFNIEYDNLFNKIIILFNDKKIRSTSLTPLDEPNRCLLSIIYIKPIEDVSTILEKYSFRNVDILFSTIENTRYVLDVIYFKLELLK